MARAKGRGNAPRILMNGQAAAYSSRCRIGKRDGTTVKNYLQTKWTGTHCVVIPSEAREPWCLPMPAIHMAQARTKIPRCARNDSLKRNTYFAASCAHCANAVKNAFAPAGGSISPISEVRNGTMRP